MYLSLDILKGARGGVGYGAVDTPIVFSEHVLEYAQSRGVTLAEITAAIRTERWHRHGRDRHECRKNFPYATRAFDTKQVRVLFVEEARRIVVVTAYAYFVRTRPGNAVAA